MHNGWGILKAVFALTEKQVSGYLGPLGYPSPLTFLLIVGLLYLIKEAHSSSNRKSAGLLKSINDKEHLWDFLKTC